MLIKLKFQRSYEKNSELLDQTLASFGTSSELGEHCPRAELELTDRFLEIAGKKGNCQTKSKFLQISRPIQQGQFTNLVMSLEPKVEGLEGKFEITLNCLQAEPK